MCCVDILQRRSCKAMGRWYTEVHQGELFFDCDAHDVPVGNQDGEQVV